MINAKQILSIVLVILGVMIASTAQLTDLIGPVATKTVVSISSLAMSILAGIQGVISSQGSLVRDVQAMPGVENIVIGKQANSTLAGLAVDSSQAKIVVAPGAETAVNKTAMS